MDTMEPAEDSVRKSDLVIEPAEAVKSELEGTLEADDIPRRGVSARSADETAEEIRIAHGIQRRIRARQAPLA